MRRVVSVLAVLALAGCAGAVPSPRGSPAAGQPSASAAPARAALPTAQRRTARRLNLPGLEGVVGATAPVLIRQFGQPRLDIHEGDARKLQFSGSACVLDVYLYPPAPGGAPEADYVDSRLPDGRDFDRAACVRALRSAP